MHALRSRRTPAAAPAAPVSAARAVVDAYAGRGRECAYGNVRMMARVLGTVYEEALRPSKLRAGQLSLLWAIVATEPVEMARLGRVTRTDATTLSRTVEKLRKARLVTVGEGADARRKEVRVTALGRERFAAAMPHWEAAQRRIDALVPVRELQSLARKLAVQPSAGAS